MTDQGKKYLSDILRSIDLIEEFVQPISSYEEYCADAKTQSAVERQLGIIGEALGKFSRLFPGVILENDKKIVGLRNRIIHAYDSIDQSIIWVIVNKYLQKLRSEIEDRFSV